MNHIRLRHELMHAAWDEDAGLWRLRIVRHVDGGEKANEAEAEAEIEDTADVLFLGVGWLNRPRWPEDIPGLRGFRGRLLHTAQWDHVGDADVGVVDGAPDDVNDNDGIPRTWHDKVVGVIGNVKIGFFFLFFSS